MVLYIGWSWYTSTILYRILRYPIFSHLDASMCQTIFRANHIFLYLHLILDLFSVILFRGHYLCCNYLFYSSFQTNHFHVTSLFLLSPKIYSHGLKGICWYEFFSFQTLEGSFFFIGKSLDGRFLVSQA